jgi:hypothetical protein
MITIVISQKWPDLCLIILLLSQGIAMGLLVYCLKKCKHIRLFQDKFQAASFTLVETTITAFIIFSFIISFEEDNYLAGGSGSSTTQVLSFLMIFLAISSILFDLFKIIGAMIYSLKEEKKNKRLKEHVNKMKTLALEEGNDLENNLENDNKIELEPLNFEGKVKKTKTVKAKLKQGKSKSKRNIRTKNRLKKDAKSSS